jgi:hypothetical protein
MAMKKTSGGDSPLRQGARKSFWTLPIFGSTAAADRDVFWKIDQVFRFYRRRGSVRSGPGGRHHQGRGPALGRAALWCGHPLARLRLLFGVLEAP